MNARIVQPLENSSRINPFTYRARLLYEEANLIFVKRWDLAFSPEELTRLAELQEASLKSSPFAALREEAYEEAPKLLKFLDQLVYLLRLPLNSTSPNGVTRTLRDHHAKVLEDKIGELRRQHSFNTQAKFTADRLYEAVVGKPLYHFLNMAEFFQDTELCFDALLEARLEKLRADIFEFEDGEPFIRSLLEELEVLVSSEWYGQMSAYIRDYGRPALAVEEYEELTAKLEALLLLER